MSEGWLGYGVVSFQTTGVSELKSGDSNPGETTGQRWQLLLSAVGVVRRSLWGGERGRQSSRRRERSRVCESWVKEKKQSQEARDRKKRRIMRNASRSRAIVGGGLRRGNDEYDE